MFCCHIYGCYPILPYVWLLLTVWHNVVLGVPMALSLVALHLINWFTVDHLIHFVLYHVFYFYLLGWLFIFSGPYCCSPEWLFMVFSVIYFYHGWFRIFWDVTHTVADLWLCVLQVFNFYHCGGFMSFYVCHCRQQGWPQFFQLSHWHSLVWLGVISGILVSFTVVALCHPKCLTAAHWGFLVSFQVFYCCLLVLL